MSERTKIDHARDVRLRDSQVKPKDKVRPKEEPSRFDRVLERNQQKVLQPGSQMTMQQATTHAAKEVRKHDQQEGEEGKEEESNEQERDGDKKSRDKKSDGKVAEQKVVAKGKMKQGKGGGGQGQQQGGGGHGAKRRGLKLDFKQASSKLADMGLQGKFEQQLKASLKQAAGSPKISQAILNQLVQYVRIGKNSAGDKEMQVELHEKIFKGLRLRVVSREGKVSVFFSAADEKTRKVFEKESDAIKAALSKSGVDVDEVIVV